MDPELWELLEEGDSEDDVAAIIRLGRPGIVPSGVRVIAQFGEIVTVRMKRGEIIGIREDTDVASFKAPGPPMGPEVEPDDTELLEGLDESMQPSDERRPPSLDATGRGVVIGIVDWGFDFAHPDFLNPNNSTRTLALWDQRGKPGPESPEPYGYGIVHTREAINRAIASSDPYAALGYYPADADLGRGSHGTLVASIAAGNSRGGGPLGIAPEAELVFVHLATWGQDRSAKLGNSVTLLEAIDFITRTAGERPCAINLSMGRTGEQHDGTTLVEQGLAAALRASPGHAICQSTGNYFQRRLHASGQLRPSEERTLVWEVSKADVTPNEFEIWYPGRDKMEVEIRSLAGSVSMRLKLGERGPLVVNGQTVGKAYHRAIEPNNLDNHIDIFLYTSAPAGEWEVTLIATDVVDGRYHAWIERDAACQDCQSHFHLEDAESTSTTGTICNGQRTIAVGAYNPHHPDQPLAPFSSMGPTRDGRLKPDLCAPGVAILGARSAGRDPSNLGLRLTRMSGTSFATPHVTGTIALMLEAAPRPIRIEEIRNLLLANTRKISFSEELPGRLGSGYLNIERAVQATRNIGGIGPELRSMRAVKEAAMNQEDQELAMEFLEDAYIEGKAEEEAEEEEAQNWQNTFHRIANDITSAFEGGKPVTLNLYDRGIISYGKHQATLASGTLYPILKRFTELSTGEIARKMSEYLDRVQRKDETLREDKDFIQLLKDAAKEPEMERAQDEEFARSYWNPAKKSAAEAGIKTALGHVILYDTRVQGGMQQVLKKTKERLGGNVGDIVGGKEITELEFLRAFVEQRIQRNLNISARQKKQAEELNKEAEALEGQAAAAANLELAKGLRLQAANKRKKAKQYVANAAALEISSNKTRGPSLRELVNSSDLNLSGDADGKIYLKGKPGVAITGLEPGATIDSTTPAEQVEEEADEEAATKRNFVLISGGPGPFDNRDVEHDQSWANYVTPPLLLTDTEEKRKAFVAEDEEVWWFVYKPAYERRWMEDSSSSIEARKKAVKQVKDRGFTSYVNLIEGRARERGWNLRWLNEADDLWKKLKTFSKRSISHIWYWGHARDDLWLSVQHDPGTGVAVAPDPDEIIKISSIDSTLKNHFRKGAVDRMNRFIGCNTVKFAEAWAKTFDVWAEGVEDKVNFASIHKTGGEPCLVGSAQVKYFSPGGKEEPGEAWRAKAVKCGTISFEALPAEVEELEAAANQIVPLKVGETYEIAVESAPSTGHRWDVVMPPKSAGLISLVEVVSESTTPPSAGLNPLLGGIEFPLVGGTVVQRFRFRALAPGEVDLSLIYRQPWVRLNVREERVVSFRINPATPSQEEAFAPSEDTEAVQAPEREVVDLVELADQAIAERGISRAPTAMLHHVLSQAGMPEALSIPGRRHPLSAAEIFDAFAYPGREVLREQLEQYFEVVALPREPLDGKLFPGDILLRRGEGGLGHLAMLTSGEVLPVGELEVAELYPEIRQLGYYTQVIELGVLPHQVQDRFARRLASEDRRLGYDQMVLRFIPEVSKEVAEFTAPEIGLHPSQIIEATPAPNCYKDIVSPTFGSVAGIGFEFDLNYGASTVSPPLKPDRTDPAWSASVYSLEGKNITTHRMSTHSFRLEGDGNRIEIATKRFELTPAGKREMKKITKDVLVLVNDLKDQCRRAKADTSLGFPSNIGAPHWFKPGYLEPGVECIFPLALNPRKSYYGNGCAVGASPQATLEIPLASVDRLVTSIKKSEGKKVAGRALSGPSGYRQGKRSKALYDAQEAVNKSRNYHLKAKTRLSTGDMVNEANFTSTLQGLLILMVSYLRTSLLTYDHTPDGDWDYEVFAKAYLPLNVKNPFRLLFEDLTSDEKQVFKELYDSPRINIWRLAKDSATSADKDNQLFPARVKGHQECWFTMAPTWDEFVDKTITNTPLLRTEFCPGKEKKGEDIGCEVLFAPLSRILPHEAGSRRVTIEMRRLGFSWVLSHGYEKDGVEHPGWAEMTEMLFDMAFELNK